MKVAGAEQQGMNPKIVACIPAFNEEKTIAKVVIKTQKHVDKVIVCDDGSTDMTGVIAEKLGAIVLRHPRNLGYGEALRTLFKSALELSPDIAVTLDADGQHDPDEMPRLIEPIAAGEADIVIGSRFLGEAKTPSYRQVGIKLITRISNISTKLNLIDAQSGYRAYSRKALELVIPSEMDMGASTEILEKASQHAIRIKEVPVNIRYDVEKPSSQSALMHGLGVLASTIKFMSIRHPLAFFGVPGAIALTVALIFWVWTLQIFATTRAVVTNIALAAIGATSVGLILLTTGIILYVLVSVVREVK
jgi:glycosyltransferase involved in cell wall biosynthesis